MAGAEVVDRQPDALDPQARCDVQQHEWIAHRLALGDLEHDRLRVDTGVARCGLDAVREVERLEVFDRNVDRQAKIQALVAPAPCVGQRAREHGLRQTIDQPARFGLRNELIGQHQTVVRVLPAHQCLDPHDLAIGKSHLGLVVVDQLAVEDRLRDLRGVVRLAHRMQHRGGRLPLRQRLEQRAQRGQRDRLAQRAREPQPMRPRQARDRRHDAFGLTADDHERAAKAPPRQVSQELHAVHARHVQIE